MSAPNAPSPGRLRANPTSTDTLQTTRVRTTVSAIEAARSTNPAADKSDWISSQSEEGQWEDTSERVSPMTASSQEAEPSTHPATNSPSTATVAQFTLEPSIPLRPPLIESFARLAAIASRPLANLRRWHQTSKSISKATADRWKLLWRRRPGVINSLLALAGLVIGVVGLVYMVLDQGRTKEALDLTKWTAWKDYKEECREEVSSLAVFVSHEYAQCLRPWLLC